MWKCYNQDRPIVQRCMIVGHAPQRGQMGKRRPVIAVLALALLVAALAAPGTQLATAPVERLTNGSFEEGFSAASLGSVGIGWQPFFSGGGAQFGFYQDGWVPVVQEGASSQLITISTIGQTGEGAPHCAGIYQTVAVVPGATYELSLHGMLRALDDDPDRETYGYRVQYGVDQTGGTSWESVSDWADIPWDRVFPRLAPGEFQSHSASIVTSGEKLTLFFRVLYKWGTSNREVDLNLDAVSLKGAMPVGAGGSGKPYTVVTGSGPATVVLPPGSGAADPVVHLKPPLFPVASWQHKVSVYSESQVGIVRLELYDDGALLDRKSYAVGPLQLSAEVDWRPSHSGQHSLRAVAYDALGAEAEQQVSVAVGRPWQFLQNGSFEDAFVSSGPGVVGSGWSAFHSEGQSQYGFYDETWLPAVFDGRHSQLIEINTMNTAAADADRVAGIYQTVTGLTPGASYRLTLRGLLRVRADDSDREGYNYRVQWGYTLDGSTDWRLVTNWAEVPWDRVYTRLDPGAMSEHTAAFEAPGSQITLFVRAWKKWATAQRELDVNLDGLRLEGFHE